MSFPTFSPSDILTFRLSRDTRRRAHVTTRTCDFAHELRACMLLTLIATPTLTTAA